MPSCKQYEGITRGELQQLRVDLQKEGVSVPQGDEVAVMGPYGIELSISYDESKQTLSVCITKKPFFIPESSVWAIIDTGVNPYVGP